MNTMDTSSTEDIFDNFCCMVVEEYLLRKNLTATLSTLRAEWQRPSEEQVVVSWFEVALKLRLPELITQNSKDRSVLENVVQALVRESSVRSRQTPDVVLTGLAAMPKTTSLPHIVDHHQEIHHIPLPRSPTMQASSHANRINKSKSADKHTGTYKTTQNTSSQGLIKRQYDGTIDKTLFTATNKIKNNLSNESWIPNDIRMRTIGRDLSAANETLTIIKKREISLAREMKRLLVSDLSRAQTEESLDATHKIPCECCMQEFLYVNLPLKVSKKAIVDIRTKWSGKLNSSTVFGIVNADEPNELNNNDNNSNNIGNSKQLKSIERRNKLLSAVPACYDQVGVCIFCAQFFQVQEVYRPSYLAITQTEKRAAVAEARRREKEFWDPLKMIEKDRHDIEAYEQQQQDLLLQQQQQDQEIAEMNDQMGK